MTSIASTIRPLTPPPSKKRNHLELSESPSRRPVKRLHSLNLTSKLSAPAMKGSPQIPKQVAHLTGLECSLILDQEFVEATKATEDDEMNRVVQASEDSSYKALLVDRRHSASQISPKWRWEMPKSKGLRNFTGALCYRNSLFQALLHSPKFVNWLTKFHGGDDCVSDTSGECISCQMRILCEIYWDPYCKHSEANEQMKIINDLFRRLGWRTHSSNGHGDPDDQLAWMLGIMRTEMPSSVFNYFDSFHNSILESEIMCGKCGHASKTRGNNERHLSIPIKVPGISNRQLQSYIKAYMDEVIQGYRCENSKCKHVSDKHRIQKIAYAPDSLLVQLKRFNYRGQKDHSQVVYGPRLDLSDHSANQSLGPLKYDLTAVISHSGTSNFGHYHCIAKVPGGKWKEFDDVLTHEVGIREAINPTLIDRDWTPYLLFYERNAASMPPS